MPGALRKLVPGGWMLRWLLAALLAGGMVAALCFLLAGQTIFDMLRENRQLRQALTHLTAESQVGYAKVLSREVRDGVPWTRLRFVETDRDDPRRIVFQQEYEIPGDVIHFDALVVIFAPQLVMDGKARALFLWRRVYGESMAPEAGLAIGVPGEEPRRYAGLLAKLPGRQRRQFWEEVWNLANDPERLQAAGVRALYGNVVYQRLDPGLIYVFKVDNHGRFWAETVPDL